MQKPAEFININRLVESAKYIKRYPGERMDVASLPYNHRENK